MAREAREAREARRQEGQAGTGSIKLFHNDQKVENLSPDLNIFTAFIEGGFLITIYEMVIKPLFI